MRVVSGIQPSGRLHLGNYLGAIQQFLAHQSADEPPLYFIADLHALTTVQDGRLLARRSLELAADLLALGLDPARAVLFRQSAIAEVAKLAWVLATVAPVGLLQRGHSYKDKVERGLAPSAGLFTYPVLMAADILIYGAGRVPVGRDQEQHLEFARDLCTKLNLAYVPGFDPAGTAPGLLALPAALILPASAVVPGTDGRKMSKSYGNTLDVLAPAGELRRQVLSVKTDSTPVAAPKPEPAALLELLTLTCDAAEAEAHRRSWRAGGVGYGAYKQRLYERLEELFGEARRRREAFLEDEPALTRTLREGAERAQALAAPIWTRVARAVGIEP